MTLPIKEMIKHDLCKYNEVNILELWRRGKLCRERLDGKGQLWSTHIMDELSVHMSVLVTGSIVHGYMLYCPALEFVLSVALSAVCFAQH